MTRARPSAARRLSAMIVGLISATMLFTNPAAAASSGELLPDLRMLAPDSFAVCGAPTSGTFQTEDCPDASAGDRWLRFDSVLMNVGHGTFRVIAERESTAVDHMHATQWIRKPHGQWRKMPTDATLAWAQEEDGHPHWHTQGMERYRLFKLPSPFAGGARVGVKRGYCFFDGVFLRPGLPYARTGPLYSFYACGLPGQSQDALRLRVGLSVGWGDEYPWNYAGQRIDIGDVADGQYLLCLSADPTDEFVELSDGNNEAWARIELTTTEAPDHHVSVQVLASGRTACQPQVPYDITVLSVR